MEGTQNRLSRNTIAIIIIIIFHAVGLAGFYRVAAQHLFMQVVPFHLLLMLAVIAYSYTGPLNKFIAFAAAVFLIGYAAEWVGVHTGLIFGAYDYGHTLGFKISGIPLMMGVNWFLLIFAAGVTFQRLGVKWLPARILLGAVVLVLLDVWIEPVAQRFDYWHWQAAAVPLGNYAGWFGVSAVSLAIFEGFKFSRQGWAAPVLLLVQFIFFILLQWA